MKRRSVVHVSPHLGGGVGRVLLNYMAYSLDHEDLHHSIYCLDYANEDALARAARIGIPLSDRVAGRMDELLDAIAAADIVLIHFWNHPLLWDLLVRHPLPPARVLLWSHVAGHHSPQIFTRDLIHYPDRFVLASPYSGEAKVVTDLADEIRKDRVRLVLTSAGIDHVSGIEPAKHEGFHVGYIGTVDYCKMHPRFLEMSADARIPGLRFTVCGGDREEEIAAEAAQLGLTDRFSFLGKIQDIRSQLASFDVFGYPLRRDHYGTGEQVLIEALAAGVPPVVLGGGAERYVVEDGFNGLVVDDEENYPRALEQLYREPDTRLRLADNARSSAQERFGVEQTAASFYELFCEVSAEDKTEHPWPGDGNSGSASAAEVLATSLGDEGGAFSRFLCADSPEAVASAEEQIRELPTFFRTETRGSPFHYRFFFPEDIDLQRWCTLLAPDEPRGHLDEDGLHR